MKTDVNGDSKVTRENASDVLKKLVIVDHFTAKKISEKTGITETTLSKIINKKCTPQAITVQKLNDFIEKMHLKIR